MFPEDLWIVYLLCLERIKSRLWALPFSCGLGISVCNHVVGMTGLGGHLLSGRKEGRDTYAFSDLHYEVPKEVCVQVMVPGNFPKELILMAVNRQLVRTVGAGHGDMSVSAHTCVLFCYDTDTMGVTGRCQCLIPVVLLCEDLILIAILCIYLLIHSFIQAKDYFSNPQNGGSDEELFQLVCTAKTIFLFSV